MPKRTATSARRQQWLEKATVNLRSHFNRCGHPTPKNIRVSIGWPRGGRKNTIGQCWSPTASSDKAHEIFISPKLSDSTVILATLAHEIAHTVAGVEAAHGKEFKRVAIAVGLEGRMTATTGSALFNEYASVVFKQIGKYPAGALTENMRIKQGTRLLKCECGDCGYTVRVTRKWLDGGAPLCPCNSEPMNSSGD